MKRDMDLIRKLLLELEEKEDSLGWAEFTVPGYTEEQVGYHAALLHEAGLATGLNCTHASSSYPEVQLERLTWAGHEFLDAAREPERWEKAKTVAAKAGGLSFEAFKGVLSAVAEGTTKGIMNNL